MGFLTVAAIIGILAAAGIILVAGFLTYYKLRQALKERYSNFWLARIREKSSTAGIPVVEVSVEDLYGNTISTDKFASLDGCSTNIHQGEVFYARD